MSGIFVTAAPPLLTVQDAGRNGWLCDGISASGPMDGEGFDHTATLLGPFHARAALEFFGGAFRFRADEPVDAAFSGGHFQLSVNGKQHGWPARASLQAGDTVEIQPGDWGNFGYVRFARDFSLKPVLGSVSTNLIARLGGVDGATIPSGTQLPLVRKIVEHRLPIQAAPVMSTRPEPVRFVWGLHADLFSPRQRESFLADAFRITAQLDRMGFRLADAANRFADLDLRSLVSDSTIPGDIQILGDGTPVVLMRDHQPTGGYPRIATVISADLNRLAQMRPGTPVSFAPVSVENAQAALRS